MAAARQRQQPWLHPHSHPRPSSCARSAAAAASLETASPPTTTATPRARAAWRRASRPRCARAQTAAAAGCRQAPPPPQPPSSQQTPAEAARLPVRPPTLAARRPGAGPAHQRARGTGGTPVYQHSSTGTPGWIGCSPRRRHGHRPGTGGRSRGRGRWRTWRRRRGRGGGGERTLPNRLVREGAHFDLPYRGCGGRGGPHARTKNSMRVCFCFTPPIFSQSPRTAPRAAVHVVPGTGHLSHAPRDTGHRVRGRAGPAGRERGLDTHPPSCAGPTARRPQAGRVKRRERKREETYHMGSSSHRHRSRSPRRHPPRSPRRHPRRHRSRSPRRHPRRHRRRHRPSSADERLTIAAGLDDAPGVAAALAAGADARRGDARGWTPLHTAAAANAPAATAALLRARASARAVDDDGNTPAHVAAAGGALRALAVLLRASRPADPTLKNGAGFTVDVLEDAAMARADDADRLADREALERDWQDRLRAAAQDDGEYEWGEVWWGSRHDNETDDDHAARVFAKLERRAAAGTRAARVEGATAEHWRATEEDGRRAAPPPAPDAARSRYAAATAAATPTARRAAHEAAFAAFLAVAAAAPPGALPRRLCRCLPARPRPSGWRSCSQASPTPGAARAAR